jgi:pyruvate dehydrogenase E2 component (dihydrolipoamide acetyltransferase)
MDFVVPKLSATMETATVLKWLKKPGERVKLGEALVEIETDKAAIEVEAPADATLATILAPEGAIVPIGAKLATLDVAAGAASAPAMPAKPSKPASAPPAAPIAAAPAPISVSPAQGGAAIPPRILASPLARRLAREGGIEIAALAGSGPHGRVRKRDVLARTGGQGAPVRMRSPEIARSMAASPGDGQALSSMRARIAETVSVSRRTIPSFTLDRWVETTALRDARKNLGAQIERETGVTVTVTDLLLQALADTLRSQPDMLDRLIEAGGQIRRAGSGSVDIGLVVALEDGMMIPVLRDLGDKSLGEIARARRDAVARVRAGRLIASDAAPAAISLSNLGTGGADRFEAIINPGQSSILAVGREHERVIARGGWPTVAPGVHLTLSVDHRLIDGVRGARFIGALAERIEFGPWAAG